MTDSDQPIWSRRIAVAEVPDEGLHVAFDADSEVRGTLARTANLRDLPQLQASFDLRRKGAGVLQVTGEVIAQVGQNCVVTLEPTEQNLHEPVDVTFSPADTDALGGGEASFAMTDNDTPEPLAEGYVDLGVIATEYFLLGIDPYPRKEGAVFEATAPKDPAENPFAALAQLTDPSKKPPLGRK
jgi:uncharacterized metal-binding protein YceD (DUF177 family)